MPNSLRSARGVWRAPDATPKTTIGRVALVGPEPPTHPTRRPPSSAAQSAGPGAVHSPAEAFDQLRDELGGEGALVESLLSASELRSLPLDAAAAYLLSLADGRISVADLVDLNLMPELGMLRLLVELQDLGLIGTRPPPRVSGRHRRPEPR